MQRADSKQHKLIYGLDIGTRSIVGTVGYMEKDHFVVVAQKVREHETRAMLDGQIHDIGAVGEMIRDVTDELEKELAELQDKFRSMKAKWENEKNAIGKVQTLSLIHI